MQDFILFPLLAFLIVLLIALIVQYIKEFHGVETDVWGVRDSSTNSQTPSIIGRELKKHDQSLELLPTQP